MSRTCKDCGRIFPETREFFGQFKYLRDGQPVIGFRNSCRECMRARSSAHAKANPDQRRERMARRIEREHSAPGVFDDADVRFIRAAVGDACRYCETRLNGAGEVDHLTPVVRGGTSARQNLTLACMPCNRAKLAKTLSEFLSWRKERGLPVSDRRLEYERPDEPVSDVQRQNFRR